VYDPWADLAARPDIICRTCPLPVGEGMWFPDLQSIALDERLDRVGRRSALAHELVHVDHGDVQVAGCGPDGPRQARRQEARADQKAARRLIRLPALAAALATHPHDVAAAADDLDVTVHLLVVRIEHLHAVEQRDLRTHLDHHGDVAA